MKSGELHQRGWFPLFCAAAMAGFVWLAYGNFEAERRYSNVVYLASNIERNMSVSPQAIRDYRGEALAMVEGGECRSDLLSAGLTLILADLDAVGRSETQDARVVSLNSANRFITHLLSCTPTDGDAWARLAMVRQALGEQPREIAALLERSTWFAPAEGSTLTARLEVWRRATDATLLAAEPALDHDIMTVLTYFPLRGAVRSLSGGGQLFTDRVVAAAASLSDERTASLRKAGLSFLPPGGDASKPGDAR